MINKFKDFLQKLRQLAQRRKNSGRAPGAVTDEAGDAPEAPPEFAPSELGDEGTDARADVSEPRLKLQRINRLSPYLYRARELLAPAAAATRRLASRLLANTRMGQQLQQTDWGALVDRLLSKESYDSHHRAFLISFFVVSAFCAGKITALLLKGRPNFAPLSTGVELSAPEDFRVSDLTQVKLSDPFKTRAGAGPKKPVSDAKCELAEVRSSLPIKLVNTVVLQDSVKSIAAVQLRSARDLKQVREGDTLDGMAKVAKIDRLELIVKNLQTGACESISSDKNELRKAPISVMSPARGAEFKAQQKIKGIENQGNRYVIAKDLLDEKLKDIQAVLTQARAIKIQQPDGSLAFKLTEIEAGSIFSYLGLQNEDVITSINGKPISDLNEVMALFGRIKNIDQLQLGVRRDGEESQLDYKMKK